MHECKILLFAFLSVSSPTYLFCFCMRLVFLLPFSFLQPACRSLQTTWRLIVICSRFPKPTIWARKKLTGLRNHAPVLDTMAAATLEEVGMVSSTPIMIMMNLLRRTCGRKMSTAMAGGIHHHVTTGTMAPLAGTLPPVTQMSRDPRGHLRGIPKTRLCAMTPQDVLHLQEGVVSPGLEGITLPTTHGIQLDIITAKDLPGREIPTDHHAASPRAK